VHNPFFRNFGPFKIRDLLNKLKIDNTLILNDDFISDIKDLVSAQRE
jgi:UDP-3-O-[3-hydroxymyristoyl] glucosamine N-acyltransferase